MCFKIDWVSLIVGSKFTVFAWFYFVFEVTFPSTSSRGACIWRGDLTEGFLHYWFGGLIFGGAYTWRNLFSEFCDMPSWWGGRGGGDKKMECPILPKAQTQKYPYWMEPHFRLLWEVPLWD